MAGCNSVLQLIKLAFMSAALNYKESLRAGSQQPKDKEVNGTAKILGKQIVSHLGVASGNWKSTP